MNDLIWVFLAGFFSLVYMAILGAVLAAVALPVVGVFYIMGWFEDQND